MLENSFEGGTSGTAISAANSGGASGNAFDVVSGTVPNFSNSNPAHGALGAAFQGTGNVQWTTSITGTNLTLWGRFYLLMTAIPSVVTHGPTFFSPTSTTTACGFIQVGSSGKLNNSAKGGTTTISTTTLSINTLYRVEFKHTLVVSGTCTMDSNLYLGDSPTLTEALPQATGTGVSTDTSINGVRWGSTNAVTANIFFIDDIQINAAGFPGPYVPKKQPPFHESLAMANRPRLTPRPRLPLAAWR